MTHPSKPRAQVEDLHADEILALNGASLPIDQYGRLNSATEEKQSVSQILEEKRKKNATASAKFRDRRKQKEKEILDRCRELEQKVYELEFNNPFLKQIKALQFELDQVRLEKVSALDKLSLLEDEVLLLSDSLYFLFLICAYEGFLAQRLGVL
ncbi:hypothetical protein K7432_011775 [Basidiobolus ranarum]|uniref:BZIP domain-containing protein n=1 Tax=Basidiobolus ranarum TaxID=34480 RepID=A0ABR2WLV6_9FUNG